MLAPWLLALCLLPVGVAPDMAAPANNIAWMYAPAAPDLLERLQTSAFKSLLPLVPAPARTQCKAQKLPLLVTWPSTSFHPEPTFWLDPSAPAAPQPLAQEGAFSKLAESLAQADVRGRVDIQRFYGAVARLPDAERYRQMLRRLGLDRATDVVVQGQLVNPHMASGRIDVNLPGPVKGLSATFGPPVPAVWPACVPKAALSFVSTSILPGPLWQLGETVAAAASPLEMGLVRVQLDAVEDRLHKRWADDILGTGPKLWTVYDVAGKKGFVETVAVLEVQDGRAAATFVGEATGVLRDLMHGATLEAGEMQGAKTLTYRSADRRFELRAGFRPDAVVLAPSAAALEAALAHKGKAPAALPGATGNAVAFGTQDDAVALRRLWTFLGGKAEVGALGRSTWTMVANGTGWRIDLASRAGKT